MVMEYIDGESLMQRMRARERFTAAELAPIAIQLLEGLAAVHLADIVHRDLKPANVFLARTETGGDFVKILDFGVCKMSRVDAGTSTGVGDLLGTLSYMSPEQLEHGPKKLDGRADLYAVGVMLYRGLSGRMPFQAKNVAQLLSELRAGRAPPIEQAVEVDDAFAAIVNRATEWDPKARYQTAAAFQAALVEWVSSTTRVERLLTEFLDVAPVERSQPRRPPPRSASSPPTVSGDSVTKTGPQPRETRKMRATTSEPASGQSAIEVEIPVDVEIEGEAEPDPLTVPKRRRPRTKRM
jgi:serine/threonine-protein kinase